MTRSLVFAAALVSAWPVSAHAAERAVDPGMAEDVQDVVYCGTDRPRLLRLHLLVNGKPARARWDDYLRRWFDFLDRDDDGVLNKDEAQHVLLPTQLAQVLDGNVFFPTLVAPGPRYGLETDGDGKVTRTLLAAWYRQRDAGPVQVAEVPTNTSFGSSLDEALFQALDADGDGRLSLKELAEAPRLLARLDEDDDELISFQELLPFGPAGPRVRPQAAGGGGAPAAPLPAIRFLLVPREDGPRRVTRRLAFARELLARYDTDRDGRLDRTESGLPAALFDDLDRNKDGQLDPRELLRWVVAMPDAEATLHLQAPGSAPVAGSPIEGAAPWARKASDALSLGAGNVALNVVALSSLSNVSGNNASFYLQVFNQADTQRRGYITRAQAQAQQALALGYVFDLADRDDNEKLTRTEVEALTNLLHAGSGARTRLSIASGGIGLFKLLDANADGRLSLRELREAAGRLRGFDKNGDGFISRQEFPEQLFVYVSQGPADNRIVNAFQAPFGMAASGPLPASNRGPLWFRKMDRNGDGDISPREFLGTPEQFKKIDTDGDGLISLAEAEKADAAFRKPGR